MTGRRRILNINENEIQEYLFGDTSDTEDALNLDEEDIGFLEDDIETMNTCGDEDSTIIIDPADSGQIPETVDQAPNSKNNEEDSPSTSSLTSVNITNFRWKKMDAENAEKLFAVSRDTKDEKEFGHILIDTTDDPSPYEVFGKVSKFDEFLCDVVIPESKLYASQKGHVFDIEIDELRAFFGMNIVMGYHVLPSYRDYWSSDPDLGVPYIANVMPLKRFEEIRSMLHFNNNDLMKKPTDPMYDRSFKIRPVLKHFNDAFLSALSPTKYQTIDEHMIKFKGQNAMKQYVKGKPVKWGFKMWCRCDSKSGYLFECDLYTGKKCSKPEHGLGEGVVLQLTEKIKGLGCQVFIDNFFNSPLLQALLHKDKILSAGTVRQNRKHVPKAQVPQDKNMKRGDIACFVSNDVCYVKWMDNRAVHMVSNFLSPFPIHEVKRRKKGSSAKVSVSCPNVIKQYNANMGGVDIMDQKKVTYQMDHRSKYKYYLRPVFDLVDIAVNNSFSVYTMMSESLFQEIEKLDAKTFRRIVARQLIGNYTNRKKAIPKTSIAHNSKKARLSNVRFSVAHSMEKVDERQRCKLCTKRKVQNRTNNKCVECGVYLCYVKDRNCFKLYHEGS